MVPRDSVQASGWRGRGSNSPKTFKLLPRQHGSEVRSHCLEARRTDRTPVSPAAHAAGPFSHVAQFLSVHRNWTFLEANGDVVALSCQLEGPFLVDVILAQRHLTESPPPNVSLHLGPKRKRSSRKQSALSPDHAGAHFQSPSITCSKITETEHTPNTP